MAKYRVTVEEKVTKYIIVEADSEEEAYDEAENSEDSDFYNHEFGANEAVFIETVE
jgi:hypothetical protein